MSTAKMIQASRISTGFGIVTPNIKGSYSFANLIRHIDFLNNTTALELLCLPPNSYAALDDCRFRGNGTDVYNPGGYRIEVNNGTEVTL